MATEVEMGKSRNRARRRQSPHYQQWRYWNELVQLKIYAMYLSSYELESKRIDTGIKIVLALASSSSIAAWVVWQHLQFLWAAIIAGSQLLSAVKELLPYQRRAEKIASLGSELADLFNLAESNWYSVAEGEFTDAQINRLSMDVRRRFQKAFIKNLHGDPLPQRKGYSSRAKKEARIYFSTFYGESGEDL